MARHHPIQTGFALLLLASPLCAQGLPFDPRVILGLIVHKGSGGDHYVGEKMSFGDEDPAALQWLRNHSDALSEEARIALLEAMRKDAGLPDWNTATGEYKGRNRKISVKNFQSEGMDVFHIDEDTYVLLRLDYFAVMEDTQLWLNRKGKFTLAVHAKGSLAGVKETENGILFYFVPTVGEEFSVVQFDPITSRFHSGYRLCAGELEHPPAEYLSVFSPVQVRGAFGGSSVRAPLRGLAIARDGNRTLVAARFACKSHLGPARFVPGVDFKEQTYVVDWVDSKQVTGGK